jgi:hypothetical protein
MSNNELWALGLKHLSEALVDNQTLSELDISINSVTQTCQSWADTSGVHALANAIPTMRALTTLNLCHTDITARDKANLERICQSKNIDLLLR